MSERRPWKRALAWLAFLGPFFFASYGFANWLASRHSGVGSIAFSWERAIPFMPWTIIPYWSIDLLYCISLFVCTTRRELDRHAQRLLLVQVISIAFFIAFPLRFSFDRPVAHGVFGFLFAALGSFDKPFNQAPSLHIGLLVVIWACFARHTPARWRWLLHAWMTLISLSILTTYQHHFIDLPTGLAVGFAAMWMLPDGESPFRRFALTSDPTRRRLAALYALGAIASAALAFMGGAWLWLFWVTIALAMVALNYAALGEGGFQKTSSGRLSAGACGLLAPYIAGAWINSRLWTWRHPPSAEVMDGVSIGRFPSGREVMQFAAVVDMTTELPCVTKPELFYRVIPVLDFTIPAAAQLIAATDAIEEGRRNGSVLVCCALGYSRSAAAVVAWLLMTHRAGSVEEAVRIVRRARPAIRLRSEHFAALEAFA